MAPASAALADVSEGRASRLLRIHTEARRIGVIEPEPEGRVLLADDPLPRIC